MPVENNKFLSFIYKKKTLFAVFFFIFFGMLIPLASSASWVDTLRKGIGTYILYITIKLAVNIAKFFTELAGSLLNWVLSPDFISLSYTNPAENTIIEIGLGVTRGFANMLLVLVLVYIAIATILRLANYETRKLLVTFIFVALLVNFAPVIVGVIVDASNIIMNFFVEDLKADAFGKIMAAKVESISAGFTERTEIESGWDQITQLAVMVPFLWILTLILLLFTILFILRYLVIWLLVILAPLAFVAYILPNTRKYFEQWWSQLINWSFIGVTCGFFLYLGLLLVTKVPTVISTPTTSGDGTFNAILPFFVSIIFLGIGFTFGLKTSAAGASAVISTVKSRGGSTARLAKKAGYATAKKVGGGMRPWVERPARKAAAGAARTIRQIGNLDPIRHIPGLRNVPGIKKIRPFAPFKWVVPIKALADAGNLRPTIDAVAKEADKISGRDKAHQIRTQSVKGPKAMGYLSSLLKGNDAQDLFRAFEDLGTDEEIIKSKEFGDIIAPLLKSAADSGMLGSTLRRDPRLAKIAHKYGLRGFTKNKDKSKMSMEQAVSKATGEARTHINDWEPEELNDKDQMRSVLANFEEDRMLQLNRNVKNGQKTMLESMDNDFSNFVRTESSFKSTSDADLERILTVKEELDSKGNRTIIESEDYKKAWEEYEKKVSQAYGGNAGFKALRSKRVLDRGYRTARFKMSAPSPGEVTMGSPQGPKGARKTSPKPQNTSSKQAPKGAYKTSKKKR